MVLWQCLIDFLKKTVSKDKPVCASEAAGNACYNTGKGQNDFVGSFDYYQRSHWPLFLAPPENNETAVKNFDYSL